MARLPPLFEECLASAFGQGRAAAGLGQETLLKGRPSFQAEGIQPSSFKMEKKKKKGKPSSTLRRRFALPWKLLPNYQLPLWLPVRPSSSAGARGCGNAFPPDSEGHFLNPPHPKYALPPLGGPDRHANYTKVESILLGLAKRKGSPPADRKTKARRASR